MHVVAIHSLTGDKEGLAGALAAILGVTVFEALARLRAPGSGPSVVAVFAEQERAERLAVRLRTGGFHTAILNAVEIEAEAGHVNVKKVDLGKQELRIDSREGGSLILAYPDIDLVVRGTCISRSETTETVKSRSLSMGKALLSGGMMITKTTKSVREVTTEQREGFFSLYAKEGPPLFFRENGLVYESLGPALRPSRAANFAYLVSEIRRRCPYARYDERLLNRTGQVFLLGPLLSPEKHLVVATGLLSKVLRERQ